MNVHSILATKGDGVITIPQIATVAQAAELCSAHAVGALVVSGDGRVVEGLLGERDLLRTLSHGGPDAWSFKVGSVMSTDVITCHLSDSVESLMTVMTQCRIRHLPVVNDDAVLAGIVSIGDVVKFRLDELVAENNSLFDYITHGR
jgi:CBS domain-containing protein